MPAILMHVIRRPSQIEIGKFYRLVGHTGKGLPIPPQVWRPEVRYPGFSGTGLFYGTLYMRIGDQTIKRTRHPIPFDDLGLDGWHDSFHDLHLEYEATDEQTVRRVLGDQSYVEIQQELRRQRRQSARQCVAQQRLAV